MAEGRGSFCMLSAAPQAQPNEPVLTETCDNVRFAPMLLYLYDTVCSSETAQTRQPVVHHLICTVSAKLCKILTHGKHSVTFFCFSVSILLFLMHLAACRLRVPVTTVLVMDILAPCACHGIVPGSFHPFFTDTRWRHKGWLYRPWDMALQPHNSKEAP